MSLLMQALKKAERAKRIHPDQDEADRPSEEFDQALELAPQEPPRHDRRATDPIGQLGLPPDALAGALSLEPIETPPTVDAAGHGEPVPNWNGPQAPEDIEDALHSAVPPAASIPPADMMAAPGAHGGPASLHAMPQRERRIHNGGGAAAPQRSRSGMPPPPPEPPKKAAAPRPMRMPNPRAMRMYVLIGVLFLIAATFGFIYWRAVYGAGSSKHLPPVPMPGLAGTTPPAANGTPAGVTGLVIPPGTEPAYGPAPQGEPAPGYAAAPGYPAAAPEQQAGYAPPPEAAQPSGYVAPPEGAAPAAGYAPPPAAQPGYAAAPQPAPVAPNVPPPTPEQMQNLSPEDYARIDRQAAAQADAAAAAAAAGGAVPPAAPGVAVQPSPPAAPPVAAVPAEAAAPPAAAVAAAPAPQQQVEVAHRVRDGQVSPALAAAYAALTSGDLAAAREQYDALLRSEPRNRDALLGAAAIALRERDPERAAGLYERALELDPMDADAMAGLVSLRSADPIQAEARLRRVINRNPEAASPVFALANLYASEGRWSEAQNQYFKAHAMAPQDPDYAFNLAVALDRINQPKLALDYYRRAQALAAGRTVHFDRAALANRIRELGGKG